MKRYLDDWNTLLNLNAVEPCERFRNLKDDFYFFIVPYLLTILEKGEVSVLVLDSLKVIGMSPD